jgi:hypothetical protein
VIPEVVVEDALSVAVVLEQVSGPLLLAVTLAGAVVFEVTVVEAEAVHPVAVLVAVTV